MKLVTVSIELGFDNFEFEDKIDFSDKESIANYLSELLYEDPEFFGGFGPENIISVKDV